jgi:hypothetical protein
VGSGHTKGLVSGDSASLPDVPIQQRAQQNFRPETLESAIAEVVAASHTITYAASVAELDLPHLSKSTARMWLVKLESEFRERLNLPDRELLVLFSDLATPDQRLATARRAILDSAEFRDRVDHVMAVMISPAPRDKIETIFLENRIWVTAPVKIMSGRIESTAFDDAIVSSILASDAFDFRSPVEDSNALYGRSLVIQAAAHDIMSGKNIGVFGLRKVGKTSVLKALERVLSSEGYRTAFLSFERPDLQAASADQVLGHLGTVLGHEPIGPGYGPAQLAIEAALTDIEKGPVVVIHDEVEWVTPGRAVGLAARWNDEYTRYTMAIRALAQQHPGRLMLVVAGINPWSVEKASLTGQEHNPLFSFVKPIYLEPLSESEIHRMLDTLSRYSGVKIHPTVSKAISEHYGGHPFLSRLAMSHARKIEVQRRSKEGRAVPSVLTLTRRNVEDEFPQIDQLLHEQIKDILLPLWWFYPDEFVLLEWLAEGESDEVDEMVISEPGLIFHLQSYGLLENDNSERIPVVFEYLRRHSKTFAAQYGSNRGVNPPDDVLAELPDMKLVRAIVERLIPLEVSLRRLIVYVLWPGAEQKTPKLISLIQEGLTSRWTEKTATNLFAGREVRVAMQDLYFNDACAVILHHWEAFAFVLTDRTKFVDAATRLNAFRRIPAHSKVVPEEQFREAMADVEWMDRCLEKTLPPSL